MANVVEVGLLLLHSGLLKDQTCVRDVVAGEDGVVKVWIDRRQVNQMMKTFKEVYSSELHDLVLKMLAVAMLNYPERVPDFACTDIYGLNDLPPVTDYPEAFSDFTNDFISKRKTNKPLSAIATD